MLTKGLGRGGTERLLAGMVRHLDPSRFRVEVAYLLPWKDAFVDEIEAAGMPVHCLNGPRATSVGWVRRLRRLVRDHDIALVHTHMPLPAVAARLALRGGSGRRPVFVHTEHNMWDRYRGLTRWANARTYNRNAAVMAVSEGVAASIRRHGQPAGGHDAPTGTDAVAAAPPGRPAAGTDHGTAASGDPAGGEGRRNSPTTATQAGAWPPVEVVVHGIDLGRLRHGDDARAQARELLDLPNDVPVVGTVGNFTAKKDQATLLRAFAPVVSALPEARLVMVGIGPLETTLRRQADDLALEGNVIFAGSRDDVFELLPGLDLFVLSSRYEGLPIALLEAMGSGVAPVATRVGGIPEVITDGHDGVLLEPGDPDALAATLVELLTDPDRRSRLANEARQRAKAFDLARAVRQIETVYDRALRGAPVEAVGGGGS